MRFFFKKTTKLLCNWKIYKIIICGKRKFCYCSSKNNFLQVFCNDFFDIFDSHLDSHLSFSLNLAACLESLSLQKVQLKPSDKRSCYFKHSLTWCRRTFPPQCFIVGSSPKMLFLVCSKHISLQSTSFHNACFVCVKFSFLGITICKSYLQVLWWYFVVLENFYFRLSFLALNLLKQPVQVQTNFKFCLLCLKFRNHFLFSVRLISSSLSLKASESFFQLWHDI